MNPIIEYESLLNSNQLFHEEYKQALLSVIESGWYILGNRVKVFESDFGSYINSSHCIGVASGMDALILAIKAFNFPKGSEVLVASNTYIASILAILHNNLRPVLVEPDLETYNINPSLIENLRVLILYYAQYERVV
jgi:dTDP-4-amino-4,6-dideoxygalactose transaminase